MKQFLSLFGLLLTVLVVAGCGGPAKPDGFPKIHRCVLTFTQGGQPLQDAKITLSSADGRNSRWPAAGNTDANGRAVIVTYGQFKGLPDGQWKVVIDKTVSEDEDGNPVLPLTHPAPGQQLTEEEKKALYAERLERKYMTVLLYSTVPLEYTSADTTTLQFTQNGKTEQTFDLGEPVHELIPEDEPEMRPPADLPNTTLE